MHVWNNQNEDAPPWYFFPGIQPRIATCDVVTDKQTVKMALYRGNENVLATPDPAARILLSLSEGLFSHTDEFILCEHHAGVTASCGRVKN